MTLFHVGQMVVCVNDARTKRSKGCRMPVKGMVYTIRGFRTSSLGDLGILLEEIVRPLERLSDGLVFERAWHPNRFRHVKPTSIEIFRKLVASTPELVA